MTGLSLPPCPECAAGSCDGCTGRTVDAAGDSYGCPCSHLARLAALEALEHDDDGSCCLEFEEPDVEPVPAVF